MDKVKAFLAVLKKHHFWVLVGLVLVLGLTIYIAAAADLEGRYQTRSKKLNDAVQGVRQITQEADHPNEEKIKNWEVAKTSHREKVFESWKTLYDKQQKDNPWPAKLGKAFLDMIKTLKPNEDIPEYFRDIYMTFIEAELEPLFKIVDYRRPELIELKEGEVPATTPGAVPGAMGGMGGMAGPGGMGGMAGMGAPGMEGLGGVAGQSYKIVGTVDWNPQDQQRIRNGFLLPKPTQFDANPSGPGRLLGVPGPAVHHSEDQRQCQHAFGRGRQADQRDANRRHGRQHHRHGPRRGPRRWRRYGMGMGMGGEGGGMSMGMGGGGACPEWNPAWVGLAAARCPARGPDPTWVWAAVAPWVRQAAEWVRQAAEWGWKAVGWKAAWVALPWR